MSSWVTHIGIAITLAVSSFFGFFIHTATSTPSNPAGSSPTVVNQIETLGQTTNAPVNPTPNAAASNAPTAGNIQDDCPDTYPPGYAGVSGAVTIESNPTGGVTIAQGERTPAVGLADFQNMLTLIANGQGESTEATNDSIVVSLQALNACRVQLLVNAVVEGGDSTWAGSLLAMPLDAISLTSSEQASLIQVIEHSNDSLDASVVLSKYSATLSATDTQALEAIVNQGGPTHTATQSTALQTYTNAQYGFSVQYPSDLTVYSGNSSFLRVFPAFSTPNVTATTVFAATDKTTGALFAVGVSTDPTQVANCLVAPQSEPGGSEISDAGNVVLNGTTFLAYQSATEALGFIIDEHDYYVLRGNTCLAMREVQPSDQSLLISSLQSQSQLTSGQQAMLQQANQAQAAAPHITAELNAMVQSFQFTN